MFGRIRWGRRLSRRDRVKEGGLRRRCGGLVGAAFSCEVLGEGQSGVRVKFDVMGAAAVALVCSSAPLGRSGWVLIVGHFVVVRVGIIKSVW